MRLAVPRRKGNNGTGREIAVNQKFSARRAQRDAQLLNQQYESEVVKINLVLKSKSGQRDALIQIVQMHNTLGNVAEAMLEMMKVTVCMAEISKIKDHLLELKNENKRKSAWDFVMSKDNKIE